MPCMVLNICNSRIVKPWSMASIVTQAPPKSSLGSPHASNPPRAAGGRLRGGPLRRAESAPPLQEYACLYFRGGDRTGAVGGGDQPLNRECQWLLLGAAV